MEIGPGVDDVERRPSKANRQWFEHFFLTSWSVSCSDNMIALAF